MQSDIVNQLSNVVNLYVIPFGWKILGAVAVWIIGNWIIKLLRAGLGRTLLARKVDSTLTRYVEVGANLLLKLLLFIAVLSVLGIETTSFAALLAALGIAIGAAWGGLLANFAAGMFLLVLRPFKVGDMITVAGVTGDVRELGLFATALDTVDNVRIFVGNNKIFSDTIYNYTTNPYRRVDLQERIAAIPNVLANPAPSVDVLEFNQWGTIVAVRPFCHNSNYWQVFFDTNRAIHEVGATAQFAVPEQRVALRNLA
jgi:small conductance mechanosensitive channel